MHLVAKPLSTVSKTGQIKNSGLEVPKYPKNIARVQNCPEITFNSRSEWSGSQDGQGGEAGRGDQDGQGSLEVSPQLPEQQKTSQECETVRVSMFIVQFQVQIQRLTRDANCR